MDLGTVSNKLRENRYENVEEVFDDLQLIWDNCKMYNPATSVFFGCYGSGFIRRLRNWRDRLRKWLRIIYPVLLLLSLEVYLLSIFRKQCWRDKIGQKTITTYCFLIGLK